MHTMMGRLLILLAYVTGVSTVHGKTEYVFGGEEHPWTDMASSFHLIDLTQGRVEPLNFAPDENLSVAAKGRTVKPSIVNRRAVVTFSSESEKAMFNMVDGDPETAFIVGVPDPQGSSNYWHEWYLDFGGLVPVNRIRFYPRQEYDFRVLPTFEVSINDGRPENLDVKEQPLKQIIVLSRKHEESGASPIVDVTFPMKYVRHVGVSPYYPEILSIYEMQELEVYGEGYVPQAWYTSELIDIGDLASWGEIRWSGGRDPNAKVLVHTRTGMDDDPDVYWRRTGREDKLTNKGPTGSLLTRGEYDQLPLKEKGPITHDEENWSFWSAPYDFEGALAGVGIASPGPRRYLQLRIDFASTRAEGGYIERLSFDYAKPPVATDVVAEIWPDEVAMGERTRFVYALRPSLRAADLGFDGVELVTVVPADTVRSVRLGGEEIPFSVTYLDDPPRFQVAFPSSRIDASRTDKVLEIEFEVSVFRYSTEFAARVLDTQADEVSQLARAGNATIGIPSDGISVRTTLGEGTIGAVSALPRTITPNGDGVNDEAEISYELFKLTRASEVELAIYALSGGRIRLLHTGSEVSGRYGYTWNGRDENGGRVPPGIYVYTVEVRTDEGTERRAGTVSVAY